MRGSKPKRTHYAGYSFASGLEAGLFGLLKAMEQGGEVTDIQVQPQVRLTDAQIIMKPDFRAFDVKFGGFVYFEAKGFETDVWKIKRKLWEFYGPAPLRVYKGSGTRIRLVEEIFPK